MYNELLSITCLPLSSLCYVVPRIVLMTLREKRDFELSRVGNKSSQFQWANIVRVSRECRTNDAHHLPMIRAIIVRLTLERKKYGSSILSLLYVLMICVSTEFWRSRIGCYTMSRKCKIQLRTLKPVQMNLVIRLVLFYLLDAEGIESNPEHQTGSTRGNSSPRGGPRG